MKRTTAVASGLLLLCITFCVAGWAVNDGSNPEIDQTETARSTDSQSAPVTASDQLPRVVGFGHVDVEGGTVPLTVPNIGQIEHVLVKEGDRVQAGQPLIRLRDQKAKAQLAQAVAKVQEAQVMLEKAQRAPEVFEFKKKMQQQAIVAAENRIEAARSELGRLEGLVQSSVLPPEKLATAKERLPELEAALEVERLRLQELQLEDPQENLRLAQAALDAAQAQRDLAQEYLDSHTLLAPSAGIVLRLMVSPGQVLGENATMPALWFCPDRPRIVRCEIEEEFASKVASGMRAEVYSDDPAGPVWRGQVTRCADWIAHRRSLLDEPFQRNDVRTLECIVQLELDGNVPEPRIGRRLRVVLFPNEKAQPPLADATPPKESGSHPGSL